MSMTATTSRFSTAEVLGPTRRSMNRCAATNATVVPAVIKIKEIIAGFEDLRATALVDKVIVQGTVVEQIFFVDGRNIVRERVERVPFSQAVVVPGTRPGMNVDVRAEVEFIITEINETGTEVKDKIVIILDVTVTAPDDLGSPPSQGLGGVAGSAERLLVDRVVGHARQQALLIKIKVFPIPIAVEKERIAVGAMIRVQEQVLVVAKIPLEAIKIKSVEAVIRNLTTQVLPGKVLFQGVVHKTISFVGLDNIVHVRQEDVPFSHVLSAPGVAPGEPVTAGAGVEFLIPELDRKAGILKQKIVLILSAEVGTPPQEITIVTDVTGEGIVTQKIQFFTDGTIVTAVTDVSGPGIAGVVKQTIVVRVVGGPPNPVPVEVVTDVILAGP